MKQPADWLKTINTIGKLDYMASGNRTNVLFKETEPPCQSAPLPPSLEPSLFMAHGHMIAADWACPLMFARARVHNVHTWEAALRGRVIVKCKGHGRGDCCRTWRHGNIYAYTPQSLNVHAQFNGQQWGRLWQLRVVIEAYDTLLNRQGFLVKCRTVKHVLTAVDICPIFAVHTSFD